VKDLDAMTVSRVDQRTLPKWWRETSGVSKGGVVEGRPLRDGRQSIVPIPKVASAGQQHEQL
jgi:hypothetical protein